MKREFYILAMVTLIYLSCSINLFAATDIKMKSGDVLLNIDSLKIYSTHITFYKANSGHQISIAKKQLENINFGNGKIIRYKSYNRLSYSGNVNLHVVNFFNGSFVSGIVNYITPDSIYFSVLNDTLQTTIPTTNISFINYGNSLVEEFLSPTSQNDSQPGSVKSVFMKRHGGETDNETFIGVKAGYVSSWINMDYGTNLSNNEGFLLGGNYYNRFSDKSAIDLSLMYVQKGGNFATYEEFTGISKVFQFDFDYIELQSNYMMLAPFRKWNLYFDVGLFMAEMIHASGINKSAEPDSSFKMELSGGQSNFNRFDFGINLGLGANFKINDRLVSIGVRMSDGWLITGNTFNYNYYNLNYFRTQNYFSFYATYGFRIKNKGLNK